MIAFLGTFLLLILVTAGILGLCLALAALVNWANNYWVD